MISDVFAELLINNYRPSCGGGILCVPQRAAGSGALCFGFSSLAVKLCICHIGTLSCPTRGAVMLFVIKRYTKIDEVSTRGSSIGRHRGRDKRKKKRGTIGGVVLVNMGGDGWGEKHRKKHVAWYTRAGKLCVIANTNLTLASNTSPGRNLPNCKKLHRRESDLSARSFRFVAWTLPKKRWFFLQFLFVFFLFQEDRGTREDKKLYYSKNGTTCNPSTTSCVRTVSFEIQFKNDRNWFSVLWMVIESTRCHGNAAVLGKAVASCEKNRWKRGLFFCIVWPKLLDSTWRNYKL